MAFITAYRSHMSYRYLDIIAMVWVTLLLGMVLQSTKITEINGFALGASSLYYPFTYIFSDIFTEVYGYKNTRRVVWTGALCGLILVLLTLMLIAVPPASFYHDNEAFKTVFGPVPLLAGTGFIAYLSGEFINSYVLAKLKIFCNGRFLWIRTIGSTMAGSFVDQTIYVSMAFLATYSISDCVNMIGSQWAFQVGYETLMTPVTYWVVRRLKQAEGMDIYDRGTNFSPFVFKL